MYIPLNFLSDLLKLHTSIVVYFFHPYILFYIIYESRNIWILSHVQKTMNGEPLMGNITGPQRNTIQESHFQIDKHCNIEAQGSFLQQKIFSENCNIIGVRVIMKSRLIGVQCFLVNMNDTILLYFVMLFLFFIFIILSCVPLTCRILSSVI